MKIKTILPALSLALMTACEFNADIWKEINAKYDGIPPQTVQLLPTTDIGSAESIYLVFDEEIDPESVDKNTIQVFENGVQITTYNLSVDQNQITVSPTNYYNRTVPHFVRILPPLSDPYRNEITAAFPDEPFTVAAAPTIISTTPADSASNVYPTNQVRIVFSEPMAATGGSVVFSGIYGASYNPTSASWGNSITLNLNLGTYINYGTTASAVNTAVSGFTAQDGTAMSADNFSFDMLNAWVDTYSAGSVATHTSAVSSFVLLSGVNCVYLVLLSSGGTISVQRGVYNTATYTIDFSSFGATAGGGNAVTSRGITAVTGADGNSVVIAYVHTDGFIHVDAIDSDGSGLLSATTTGFTDAQHLRLGAPPSRDRYHLAFNNTGGTPASYVYTLNSSVITNAWASTGLSASSDNYPIDIDTGSNGLFFVKGDGVRPNSYNFTTGWSSSFYIDQSGPIDNLHVRTLGTETVMGVYHNFTLNFYRLSGSIGSRSWTYFQNTTSLSQSEFDMFVYDSGYYAAVIDTNVYIRTYDSGGPGWVSYTFAGAGQDISQVTNGVTATDVMAIASPYTQRGIIAACQNGNTVTVKLHR